MHLRAPEKLGILARVGGGLVILSLAMAVGWAITATSLAASGTGSSYVPLTPYRVLDTRLTGQPVGSTGPLSVTVVGVDSVPADATAVALNLTVTAATSPSYLSIYPAGSVRPTTSNLNYLPAETVADLTVVPIGSNGQVTIYNAVGTAQVIVDLEGYFEAPDGSSTAGRYVGLTPARITDTRPGSGEPNSGNPIAAQSALSVQVTGQGGVPTTGVGAVALNVTATQATQSSYLTAFPSGVALPLASNLNFGPGSTVANMVVVPLGTEGQISLFNAQGTTDAIVDVVGYFTTAAATSAQGSLYYPLGPTRVVDTRVDAGTIGQNSFFTEQFAGVDGVSPTASAILANLTATNPSEASYFSVVPGQSATGTSDLNFNAGETVPNLVIPALNASGQSSIYNNLGTADAIVDVFGYFQPVVTGGQNATQPCTSASLDSSVTSSTQGTPVGVTASSVCPGSVSYEFWEQPSYTSAWTLVRGWATSNTYSYPTSDWAPGTYTLAVWASTGAVYQSASGSTGLTSDATILVPNVTYSPQVEGMTCEEATLEMGLSHEGITVTQQQVLNAEGDNESVPGIGPAYTRANPMVNFVGPPNGGEASGYEPGAYYGAIVDAAHALGGEVLAAGENINPQEVYDEVDQGHPVEVWVTFNFHVEYSTSWLSDGAYTWPWAGPDEHAVLVVGITNGSVEIDNPWADLTYGAAYVGADQWIPMATFQSVYAVYADMAVVLN